MNIATITFGLIACLSGNKFDTSLNFQEEKSQEPIKVPTVAIYPWTFAENEKGTTSEPLEIAQSTLKTLFEKRATFEIASLAKCEAGWKDLGFESIPLTTEELGQLPILQDTKKLLSFGERLGVDYVCSGTLGWTVRSIWVGLGPKTKAAANINLVIIDVKRKEVVLEQRDYKSDSKKAEKWYETAGTLFVSIGFTVFSGGPKTPHMKNAAIKGLAAATDPFFVSLTKKIR